jgi:hypothetical protein
MMNKKGNKMTCVIFMVQLTLGYAMDNRSVGIYFPEGAKLFPQLECNSNPATYPRVIEIPSLG